MSLLLYWQDLYPYDPYMIHVHVQSLYSVYLYFGSIFHRFMMVRSQLIIIKYGHCMWYTHPVLHAIQIYISLKYPHQKLTAPVSAQSCLPVPVVHIFLLSWGITLINVPYIPESRDDYCYYWRRDNDDVYFIRYPQSLPGMRWTTVPSEFNGGTMINDRSIFTCKSHYEISVLINPLRK